MKLTQGDEGYNFPIFIEPTLQQWDLLHTVNTCHISELPLIRKDIKLPKYANYMQINIIYSEVKQSRNLNIQFWESPHCYICSKTPKTFKMSYFYIFSLTGSNGRASYTFLKLIYYSKILPCSLECINLALPSVVPPEKVPIKS